MCQRKKREEVGWRRWSGVYSVGHDGKILVGLRVNIYKMVMSGSPGWNEGSGLDKGTGDIAADARCQESR